MDTSNPYRATFLGGNCRPWQINLSVMYVRVPLFYNICFLTYFCIKRFVRAHEAHISYLHSSQTQTIMVVLSITWSSNLLIHEKLTNLLPRTFLYNFMKETFARKNKKNLENDFLELLFQTSWIKLLLLIKKIVYITSVNTKTVWFKFLFIF